MKTKRVLNVTAAAAFIAAEAALYICFMCFDLGRDGDLAVKYSSVLLCAAFALFLCKGLRLSDFLLFAALIFTAVSDWFLLITGENIEVGLVTFIIAQLLHFARIYAIARKKPFISLCVRIILSAAVIIALAIFNSMTALTALAAVYFSNLLVNFANSFKLLKINKLYALLSLGLLLFICCDICVGAYNFGSALSIELPTSLISFAETGMWAFYLPSQTLIVLSGEITLVKRNEK